MDESVIEPAYILRIPKDQPVSISVFYFLVKEKAHLFCIPPALFHVDLRSLKQLAEKSHTIFLLNSDVLYEAAGSVRSAINKIPSHA